MAEGYNRVQLLGNIAEPEFRETQSGGVLKLRVATTERRKKGDTWEDFTEWSSVVCFGKRASGLARILTKGDRVFVEGSLRTSSFDKAGVKTWKTEVIAREIVLNGRRDGGSREQPTRTGSAGGSGYSEDDYGGNYDDDQIPF